MSDFHFLRPWWFLALLPVVWLLIALWRSRTGGSAWRSVLDPQLLERLWLEPPGLVSRLPLWLLGLAWLLAVLALTGPVWERQPEPVWQAQSARILILDLSASMNAEDLAPSRLERARFKILDILARSREGRTGLVVFAGEAHTVAPLTDDGDTIANLLSAVSTDIIPAPGDAGAPALKLAGELLDQAGVRHGDLLLLSDGIVDPAAALVVVRQLSKQGHRLSVLGVGTAQGAPVPKASGGFAGMARLPVDTLQGLARAGTGTFSLLTNDERDLARVLLEPYHAAPLQQQGDTGVERWIERGVWLLPLVLLLAVAGFRRGWLAGFLVILILPPPVHAFAWQDLWWRQDQQAAQALEQGQPEVAAERFSDARWRGVAQYQNGDYPAAAQSFADSSGVEAGYNRGNALARAGQLEAAADAYRQVLEQVPQHADAKANLELVEKLLQQQQNQQHQQQQSQQDSQSEQDKQQQAQSGEGSDQQEQQQAQGEQQQAQQQDQGQQQDKAQQQDQAQQNQAEADQAQDQAGAPQPDEKTDQETEARQAQQQQQEDSMEAARRDVADRNQSQQDPVTQQGTPDGQTETSGEPTSESELPDEKALAMKQWLRQIPDDPAGLLRRKFMVEHLIRMRNAQ